MIYQLLRTSAFLTGQIRHDLIVNDDTVESIVLTPVSDTIAFNENEVRPILNYSHLDNIRYMYKLLGDGFFSNPEKFSGNKYLYNDGLEMDTHDNTYISGLKRLRYRRYNKQYSFMIPMWVSECIDFEKLKFHIKLTGYDSSFINIEKYVSLSPEIAKYYNEYFSTVNDDVINFKMDTNEVFISGVDVEGGKETTKDVSYMLTNILKIERPLMEADYLFLSLFKDNLIISKQMINFNLIFDILDLTTLEIIESLIGRPLNITVDVIYDGVIVTKKDLYTNYTHIPATKLEDNKISFIAENVLEYMSDNNNIDFVYKNKLTQPIFHWALLENPEFSYNLYDGYAPNVLIDGEYHRIQGQYFNQGDLTNDKYNIYDNNLCWCRYDDYTQLSDYILKIQIEEDDSNDIYTSIPLTGDITWFNNNKYDITNIDRNIASMKVRIIKIRDNHNVRFESEFVNIVSADGLQVYAYGEDIPTFIILSADPDKLTIGYLKNVQCSYSGWETIWSTFTHVLNGYIKPYKIIFKNTVIPTPVKRVEGYDNLKEIEYYKVDDNYMSYVYRYFGKLIPHFIDIDDKFLKNITFYYEQWYDVHAQHIKVYNTLLLNGYLPNYPSLSIGDGHSFYALLSEDFDATKHGASYDGWEWEIPHAFDNKIYTFPVVCDFSIRVNNYRSLSDDEIENIIYSEFAKLFKAKQFNDNQIRYIRNLYDLTTTFDYASIDNVNDIIYNVKISLK